MLLLPLMLSLLLLNHCPGWWQIYRYFPAHMLFLKRQRWQKYLLSPVIFLRVFKSSLYLCLLCVRSAAAASTRNDVKTMREASLSLAASGFSLLPWQQQQPLPARVGLPVFIHFCVHAPEELQSAMFTLPYMGFYEQWAQGFPQCQKRPWTGIHVQAYILKRTLS